MTYKHHHGDLQQLQKYVQLQNDRRYLCSTRSASPQVLGIVFFILNVAVESGIYKIWAK